MWRNEVMPPFIEYLRTHNECIMQETGDPSKKVSIFGMDLYSLHRSAEEVLKYLERVDPEGAKAARRKYNCFERFGEDTTRYAFEAQFGLAKMCHNEVIQNLRALLRNHQRYIEEQLPDGNPEEEQFMAEMNALVVRDAEEYYRTMMTEDAKSWNLRDDHFARVLRRLAIHEGVDAQGFHKDAKIVVWAHNSHIGDARATDMGKRRGEINVGQRCREIFGDDNVFNIGFLTDKGTVTAAFEWDDPPRVNLMNPPLEGSLEQLLDEVADDDAYLITHRIVDHPDGDTVKEEAEHELTDFLNRPRYQRFIGVIYRKMTEIPSHYSKCSAADQYDAVAIVKNSRAIQPMDADGGLNPNRGDLDLTFPFGY